MAILGGKRSDHNDSRVSRPSNELSAAFELLRTAQNSGIQLAAVDGRLRVTAARKPTDEFISRIRDQKAAVIQLLTPLRDRLEAEFASIFNATPVLDTEPADSELLDCWLLYSVALLKKCNSKGRPGFTRSEVDTAIIGLRAFADPEAVALLEKLQAVRKNALTASDLARGANP